jgi:hypothetical protein
MRVAERLSEWAPAIELHQRLRWAECPVPRGWAIRNADIPMPELAEWVRGGLARGQCMRTSQAEHIARGETLARAAHETGTAPAFVLDVLTWAELPATNGEIELA